MLKGFKEFLLRGNIVDLAVAVVIGTAFTALIAAFTKAFIEPLINSFFYLLGVGADGVGGSIALPGNQQISFGTMITAIITFVITAAVVYFFFVVPVNKAKDRFGKSEEEELAEETELLREIRDLLTTQNSQVGDLRNSLGRKQG